MLCRVLRSHHEPAGVALDPFHLLTRTLFAALRLVGAQPGTEATPAPALIPPDFAVRVKLPPFCPHEQSAQVDDNFKSRRAWRNNMLEHILFVSKSCLDTHELSNPGELTALSGGSWHRSPHVHGNTRARCKLR
eukprot:gene11429-biopygen18391